MGPANLGPLGFCNVGTSLAGLCVDAGGTEDDGPSSRMPSKLGNPYSSSVVWFEPSSIIRREDGVGVQSPTDGDPADGEGGPLGVPLPPDAEKMLLTEAMADCRGVVLDGPESLRADVPTTAALADELRLPAADKGSLL